MDPRNFENRSTPMSDTHSKTPYKIMQIFYNKYTGIHRHIRNHHLALLHTPSDQEHRNRQGAHFSLKPV